MLRQGVPMLQLLVVWQGPHGGKGGRLDMGCPSAGRRWRERECSPAPAAASAASAALSLQGWLLAPLPLLPPLLKSEAHQPRQPASAEEDEPDAA